MTAMGGKMPKRASWKTDYPASAEILNDGFTLRIVLPVVPPSANRLKRKFGRHIAASIREYVRQTVGNLLLETTGATQGLLQPAPRRRLTYIVYRAQVLDEENKGDSTKAITDALTKDLGLLKDDNERWCEYHHYQTVAQKGKRRIEILIEAMEDGE